MEWMVGADGDAIELTQMGVQLFLWYFLPRKWLGDKAEHHEVAWSLGDFLAALGLDRYAAICRDPSTHHVIDAHHQSDEQGRRALREALDESGVEPPDTPTLAWSAVMGMDEARIRDEVSSMLEAAIVSGDLAVGARGWKARASRLTVDHLTTPKGEYDYRLPRDVVHEERARRWVAEGGQARKRLYGAVLDELDDAYDASDAAVAQSLEPVRMLLDGIGDGVAMTQAGYLPKALAVEWCDRFCDDRPSLHRANSEADVPPLRELHALLRRSRLLTRRGRKVSVSGTARKWIADDRRLLEVLAVQSLSGESFDADVAVVCAAGLLTAERTLGERELMKRTHTVVADRWSTRDGRGVDEEDVRWSGHRWLWIARTLRWLDTGGDWGDRTQRLTHAGRLAARAGLASRAYAPRVAP
jgi:hypothetical protein